MKSFGVNWRFIISTSINNIKTCFWILLFLGGLKLSIICRVWNKNYLNSKFELQNLQHRSLVQRAKDGILYIHEQLRDMGQNIAMELPIMNRFIWKSNKSKKNLQRMRLSPYYFNLIILFWFPMIFLMSRTKCFNFESWFYKYMFLK
jgi:hypothetical protein